MEILKEKYSITELSESLKVTDHALRFYEKEFNLNIPKDNRGRRYYTTELANVMYQIKNMRDEGLEIKAIKKILANEGYINETNSMGFITPEEQLPAVVGQGCTQLSSNELGVILEALNGMKDQLYSSVSTEFSATREYFSKEITRSKLELGACVENSSRKLELKLDRHFQEVDRALSMWREKKNNTFASKLKRIIGK